MVYRPVSLIGNDIAIGVSGLGFVVWASQSEHSVATAAMFLRNRSCVAQSPYRYVIRTLVLPRRKAAEITAQMAERVVRAYASAAADSGLIRVGSNQWLQNWFSYSFPAWRSALKKQRGEQAGKFTCCADGKSTWSDSPSWCGRQMAGNF